MIHTGIKRIKKEIISNDQMQEIIEEATDRITRDLICFQYALACRAGELAREFTHKPKGEFSFVSPGLLLKDFTETKDKLVVNRPNFKNKALKRHTVKLSKYMEPWLINPILKRIREKRNLGHKEDSPMFPYKHSKIKMLIDAHLKKYNFRYSTHCLRHSRATYLVQKGLDSFEIQHFLGHATADMSQTYVHANPEIIADKMRVAQPIKESEGNEID